MTLSPHTFSDLSDVPARWRSEVDRWRIILEQVTTGTLTKPAACTALQMSRATLDRKLAAMREHGVRGLVPNYKAPQKLPNAFVDHWKALCERFQRKTAAAYRELLRQWRDRHPIPGYTGHPGWPDLPAGWDQRTLYRYQPSDLELDALRHGLGRATMLHAPKINTTRVGMHHLQFLTGDDVKLDMKGHLGTSRELCCPLQVGFMEVSSANRFLWGTKPAKLKDLKKGGRVGIEEGDVRFLLCSQLLSTGLSKRGTTYLLEHGTFTMRDRVIDILNRYYGPRGIICPDVFHVNFSGMIGKAQAICGMGDGRGGGGNPFFKAWIESLHNLIHNELAALPAQTGHDRDAPEHLGVIERESEQLFKLAERIQPEFAAMLKFPTLEFHTQLVPAINHILETINRRTDHSITDYEKLGWMTRSYRLTAESQEWKTDHELMALPTPVREAYLHMAGVDKRCFMPRLMSPHEVFSVRQEQARRQGEILSVPESVIAEILYEDLARPCKAGASDPGKFSFEDQEVETGKLRFDTRIIRPDGREEELKDGETYDVVLNPFDPKHLYVFSATRAKGSFLGIAPRNLQVQRSDQEAVERAFGRSKQRFAEKLGDTRRRNTHRTREAAARLDHNADVMTRREEFTRRATALLNQSTTHADTHANNNTHEDEPNW